MSGDLDAGRWQAWIEEVCTAMGVDPRLVNLDEVHALSGVVARDVVRPMAPVSAFIWGVACARHPGSDPSQLRDAIVGAIPVGVPS
ncbi:MAG TPA: DUF6457 domain-containing protein [Propionibacteriaceae bacterium]|nr:DUF6457 domain-containing protein [Propionibacteriaceae bacterium]